MKKILAFERNKAEKNINNLSNVVQKFVKKRNEWMKNKEGEGKKRQRKRQENMKVKKCKKRSMLHEKEGEMKREEAGKEK